MIAAAHLAVGAAVGLMVQDCLSGQSNNHRKLVTASVAGFASHILLDAFPHQEYTIDGFWLGAVLFLEIISVFMLILSFQNSWLVNSIIFFGMVGGALPDVTDLVYKYLFQWQWLGNLGGRIHYFHGAIPISFEVNLFVQLLLALLVVASIIFARLKSA